MNAQELMADSITATLTSDVEGRLAAVRNQIGSLRAMLNELQHSEAVLVNVLATLASGVSPLPEQRTHIDSVLVATGAQQDDIRPAEESPVPPASSAGPVGAEKPSPRRKVAKQSVKKPKATASPRGMQISKDSEVAPVTLPERIREFLLTHPGPQKIGEIAQALFGTVATQSHANQVRAAAEALVRRGDVEKDRQGQSVFYQTITSDQKGTADALTAEEA